MYNTPITKAEALGLLYLLCVMLACHPPGPGPVPPRVDGGPGDCAAACANLQRMECPGANGSPGLDDTFGTPDDIACTPACVGVEAQGLITMATACMASAPTCELADHCMEQPTP